MQGCFVQDMMEAVEKSGAYTGSTTFIGPEGNSKGKLVSNCTTLRALGWQPKYGKSLLVAPPGIRDGEAEIFCGVH